MLPVLSAHLCNYRRFPSIGCEAGSLCNRLSGMCVTSTLHKVTTTQEPVFITTNGTASTTTRHMQLTVRALRTSLLAATPRTMIIHDDLALTLLSNVSTTRQTYLPEDVDEGVNGLPNSSESFSSLTIAITVLSIISIGTVLCVVIYVICRMLRRPVDLFSTSADVFELTFMSNE